MLLGAAVAPAQPPRGVEALLDRTLALVGGAIITESDVVLATALHLTDDLAGLLGDTPLARLIDRRLILLEVARFAPPDPPADAVQARLEAVRARAGSAAAVTAALTRAGATMAFLITWVRDDLRLADYLDQRFASSGTPTEAEVDAYQRTHGDELAGVLPAERADAARRRLVTERRRALVADWLADVRRRTEVIEFKD